MNLAGWLAGCPGELRGSFGQPKIDWMGNIRTTLLTKNVVYATQKSFAQLSL